VNGVLYIAGGSATPQSTEAMHTFWALDLRTPEAKWEVLPPWPGPARILGVAGATADAFYLFSGADLSADKDGKAVRKYLVDAYSYRPGQGWTRLPELPRPAVAAPSPAPLVGTHRLVLISGDDGMNVHFEPVEKHPGFPRTCQAFDTEKKAWSISGGKLSLATAPVVPWDGASAIVNGEVRPRVRTPEVHRWSAAD
jgi:N-acetylneuraminic acid mutarotase